MENREDVKQFLMEFRYLLWQLEIEDVSMILM